MADEVLTTPAVSVKLKTIDFVPSWQTGGGPKQSIIGQVCISCEDLPQDIQDRLREICVQAWYDHLMGAGE